MKINNYYFILSISLGFILFHFINIAFTGGDDPFIALDHIEKGGLLKAAVLQAQGQGRFYLILTWFLSEASYFFGFEIASIIKIISTLVLFYLYFILIKKIFGRDFSILNFLITLLFYDWWGGDFNFIHNSPLWYALGTIFLILAFIYFTDEIKNSSQSFKYSIIFFSISLLFYEIFLFYVIIFPLTFIIYNKLEFNFNTIKITFKKFKYLFLVCCFYLITYISFRYFYPSLYDGNQDLYFGDILNSLFTIIRMSLMGLGFKYWHPFSIEIIIKSIIFSVFVSFVVFKLFKKNSYKITKLNLKDVKYYWALLFVLCAILPNILFGLSQKYHSWYGPYVGSFLSALALIPLITIFSSYLNFKFRWFKNIFFIICVLVSSGIYMNFFYKFEGFKNDKQKLEQLEGLIVTRKIDLIDPNIFVCLDENFLSTKSYRIYDYLSKYFSNKRNHNIYFNYVNIDSLLMNKINSKCNLIIIESDKNKLTLLRN